MTFKTSPLVLGLGLGLLSLQVGSAAPTLLGLGANTTVRAVSGDGTAACGVLATPPTTTNGARWVTATGAITVFPDFAGGPVASDAFGISTDGSVIVGVGSGTSGYRPALLWTSSTMAEIPALGQYTNGITFPKSAVAYGVSGDGTIAVGTSTSSTSFNDAFRWITPSVTATAVGRIPGDAYSTAYAISTDGTTVVGQSSKTVVTETSSTTTGQAFYRKYPAGAITGIGDLAGGSTLASAKAVSANGSIIVGRGTIAVSAVDQDRGFKWTQAGGMIQLDTLAGGIGSDATGISSDGTYIVGTSTAVVNTVNTNTAVIWGTSTTPKSLPTLLTAAGVDLTGWTLNTAVGISANGNVIVGNGVKDGVAQGWVIKDALQLVPTPVAPPTKVIVTGSQLKVQYITQSGLIYQVERSPSMLAGTWTLLGGEYTATGVTTQEVIDPGVNPSIASPTKYFYRVRVKAVF